VYKLEIWIILILNGGGNVDYGSGGGCGVGGGRCGGDVGSDGSGGGDCEIKYIIFILNLLTQINQVPIYFS